MSAYEQGRPSDEVPIVVSPIQARERRNRKCRACGRTEALSRDTYDRVYCALHSDKHQEPFAG